MMTRVLRVKRACWSVLALHPDMRVSEGLLPKNTASSLFSMSESEFPSTQLPPYK